MNLFDLSGKIAFVTGAGSGIGQRLALGLAEAGANVAAFDLAASAGLAETVQSIEKLGRRAMACAGDVTRAEDLENAVAATEKELGPLAIALNCAGIASAIPRRPG